MQVPTNHIDHTHICKYALNIINIVIEHFHTSNQVSLYLQRGDSYWTLMNHSGVSIDDIA